MQHRMFSKAPTRRCYIHANCGGVTEIDGDDYIGLCDPMCLWLGLLPQRTRCCECGSHYPLSEFAWEKTGETLADYRARLRGTIHPVARWGTYGIRVFLFFALPTASAYLGWRYGGWIGTTVGLAVGAFLGLLAVGAQMLHSERDMRRFI